LGVVQGLVVLPGSRMRLSEAAPVGTFVEVQGRVFVGVEPAVSLR
jgi:hypothetical protein